MEIDQNPGGEILPSKKVKRQLFSRLIQTQSGKEISNSRPHRSTLNRYCRSDICFKTCFKINFKLMYWFSDSSCVPKVPKIVSFSFSFSFYFSFGFPFHRIFCSAE